MTKTLVIIPARKNSKRLPGKNVKIFAGLPLIEHTIKLASTLPVAFDIVVSTDNIDIKKITDRYHRVKFDLRPDELATDDSPAIAYVKHVLATNSIKYDYVLILQPTSPFTNLEDILACADLIKNSNAATVVSVVKANHMYHPDKFKILNEDRVLHDYFREEQHTDYKRLATVYVRNCSIYLTRIDTIEKQGKIIGTPCIGYEMPAERSIDINDQIDFDFATFLLSRNNKC